MEVQLFVSMGDRNQGAKLVEAPPSASTGGLDTCVGRVKGQVSAHTESKNLDVGSVEEARFASMGRGKHCANLVGATFVA